MKEGSWTYFLHKNVRYILGNYRLRQGNIDRLKKMLARQRTPDTLAIEWHRKEQRLFDAAHPVSRK